MDSNNLTPLRKGVVGVQFLFVAFGATVLVPLLVGLDPSTALFTAGIGTLIFSCGYAWKGSCLSGCTRKKEVFASLFCWFTAD